MGLTIRPWPSVVNFKRGIQLDATITTCNSNDRLRGLHACYGYRATKNYRELPTNSGSIHRLQIRWSSGAERGTSRQKHLCSHGSNGGRQAGLLQINAGSLRRAAKITMFCLIRMATIGNTIRNTPGRWGHATSSTPQACFSEWVRGPSNIIRAGGTLVIRTTNWERRGTYRAVKCRSLLRKYRK